MHTAPLLAVLLAAFTLVSSAVAQTRLATIDLRKVFDDYHKTRTADSALKDEASELDKERKSMLEGYTKAKEEYEKALASAGDQAVSADEREKRKKAAESKLLGLRQAEQEITQYDREARTRLDEKQRRMRENILEEIRAVINAKAKAGNYSMVIDTAAETVNKTPVVLYNTGETDITAAVLEQLNITAPPPGAKPEPKNGKK
jgi:Skp family chaperone for outer membrane proteins